jgi:hypothetical protein
LTTAYLAALEKHVLDALQGQTYVAAVVMKLQQQHIEVVVEGFRVDAQRSA